MQGIALAGNVVVDVVKNIDRYPEIGMLSNISSLTMGAGGCVVNTGVDIMKMDPAMKLSALGCVGDDEYGRFLLTTLADHGIDTAGMRVTDKAPTSFSDVMNLPTGERTFFHARGANALFSPADVDIDALDCRILHTGYLLLLDSFDREDAEYGTVMARYLRDVQRRGIKTSIDVVSDSAGNFPRVVIPALRYCDYVIVNEIECTSIWGMDPRDGAGALDIPAIRSAMEKTMGEGVKEKVIVHSKEAGFCLDKTGAFLIVPSLAIPEGEIRGSVGAGDAYCAGCLYGIYHGFGDREILEYASAAAACSLFAENAQDGMRSREEIMKLMAAYGRKPLNL